LDWPDLFQRQMSHLGLLIRPHLGLALGDAGGLVTPAPAGTYVADGPAHGGPTTTPTSIHTDDEETGRHGTPRARGDARRTGPGLRSALQGLGSLRERQARRAQMSADQTRVAAAADRHQFEAYQQAQDAMLREQLGNVTTDKWWDTTTPQDMARTVDLAERYAGISPYANAALDNVRSEAERRGVDLTAPPRDVHQGAQVAENAAAVDRVVAAVEELPAGSDTLDDYRSTDNRRDVIDPAAHHSGPAPGREPQGQTRPPAAAQTHPTNVPGPRTWPVPIRSTSEPG